MSATETVSLCRNALRALSDPTRALWHARVQFVLRAVQDEWERRKAQLGASDGFPWLSTRADGGLGNLVGDKWLPEGLLKFMGYVVGGTNGKDEDERQRILSVIFDGPLPPVFPRVYLEQWSRPGTSFRLRKLAETLAAFTRNAKRRQEANLDSAIADWEENLEFLFHKFYRGRFGFGLAGTAT